RSSRRLSLARTPAVQREVAPNKLSCVVLSVIQHIPLLLLEIVLNLYSAINNPFYFYEAISVKSHLPTSGCGQHQFTCLFLSAQYFSRRSRLRILPAPLFGRGSSSNSTLRGTL